MTSSKADLLEAVPVYRLVCSITDRTVGIEYRWNTGEVSILWRDSFRKEEDLVRQPIARQDVD